MTETTRTPGKTTIALDVLMAIARLTALSVPGVSRLAPVPSDGVKTIFKRSQQNEGVVIEVKDDVVSADIYVILKNDVNIRDIGRNIQHQVARAISEMVGMQVGRINIHVEDIDYPPEIEA